MPMLLPLFLSLDSPAFSPQPLTQPCTVTDGDTIRCGAERIRLLGIDAPEMPGHCRATRVCALGDPWQSKASLTLAMRRGPLSITRWGRDRYGRTLATVRSGSTDLSCWQIEHRHATYMPKWDDGGAVASICPSAIR